MPLVETARGPLWYAHHNPEAAGMPLLLVHGAGSHLDWPAELRRLPGRPVIAINLPGHGKSPGPGRTEVGAYAQDVLALLDVLALPQVLAMGQSMGGAICQTLGLEQPQRLAGLVLAVTGALLPVNPQLLQGLKDSPEAMLEKLAGWMWGRDTSPDKTEASRRHLLGIGAETLHGDYTACSHFDLRDRLGQIGLPALVIGGMADRMTPLHLSEQLVQGLPDAELVVIGGGNHMLLLEQPVQVAAVLQEWLARRGL